jgi:ParB-like chromosome segregation protein Spo0J
MELEPRTTAPAHATGAVEFVPLADIADDATFRLRDAGDLAALAASIGRLGHLVPVELRPLPAGPDEPVRYQVVAGFRRLGALRLLARERVLARVHAVLDDEDAWAIALAQALLGEPLRASELEALRARLAASRTAPWADELVDEALVRAPVEPDERERFLAFLSGAEAPEPVAEDGDPGAEEEADGDEPRPEADADAAAVEVTPEELVEDLAQRMFDVNQDLALAYDAWADLPEEGRRMIVDQARYVAELLPHLKVGRR